MAAICENLKQLVGQIETACLEASRNPSEIELLTVSKYQPAARIQEAMDAGLKLFAESRVQEAADKIGPIKRLGQQWHFIGPLQKNKINKAISYFDVIQSVCDLKLAQALSNRLVAAEQEMRIYVQINISKEEQKSGLGIDEAAEALGQISSLPGLKVEGLMGMAGNHSNKEHCRPEFALLRQLMQKVSTHLPALKLSMGMSQDFKQAIAEGADMIRVGSALFK